MLGTLDQSSIANWARPELIFRLSTELGSTLASLHVARFAYDGFQARSLRKILGIPHSYLSRVPNVEVLKQAAAKPYSKILMYRQLQLIARIAALPSSDVMRTCVFEEGSFQLQGHAKRPKQVWTSQVYQLAVQVAGDFEELTRLWSSPPNVWRQRAQSFCFGN